MSKVTFKYKNKTYGLTYTIKDVETFENVLDKSLLSEVAKTRGMFPISELRLLFAYGVKTVPDGQPLDETEAGNLFNDMVSKDYPTICANVTNAIYEDCPFLFPES